MTDIPPPFDALWFRVAVGLLVGLALGSFATMLSYRLPRRLSIVAPGSACPSCKTHLRPRDLVPVLSWVAQGGKCRYCGVSIGWRYVLIEIAVGMLTALAFGAFGFTLLSVGAVFAMLAAVTALVIRLER